MCVFFEAPLYEICSPSVRPWVLIIYSLKFFQVVDGIFVRHRNLERFDAAGLEDAAAVVKTSFYMCCKISAMAPIRACKGQAQHAGPKRRAGGGTERLSFRTRVLISKLKHKNTHGGSARCLSQHRRSSRSCRPSGPARRSTSATSTTPRPSEKEKREGRKRRLVFECSTTLHTNQEG